MKCVKYGVVTPDSREYSFNIELKDIVDKFAVFEYFCRKGFIRFQVVPVARPRVGQEPKGDDALFDNRGGCVSYAYDKEKGPILLPVTRMKKNQALHKVIDESCVFINTVIAK
jgi:hypothetical protein